jgi:hypothetical protein
MLADMGHGVLYMSYVFLTLALVRGKCSTSISGRFTAAEAASITRWIGDWLGPKAGFEDVEKKEFWSLPLLKICPLGRKVPIQTLYQRFYPGSYIY